MPRARRGTAREKLLDAALAPTRRQGFAANKAYVPCIEAVVANSAFFHHSRKKTLPAATEDRNQTTGARCAAAACHDTEDPLDRVTSDHEVRKARLEGGVPIGTFRLEEERETCPAK